MNSAPFYRHLLRRFVETGEVPDISPTSKDPLALYLAETMADTHLQALVLSDKVAARVFIDTMSQFVSLNLQKAAFQLQRTGAEQRQLSDAASWSYEKRRDGWTVMLQMLNEKYSVYGFDTVFYQREFQHGEGWRDDAIWETMLSDWRMALELSLAQRQRDFVRNHRENQKLQLQNNLKNAVSYAHEHNIELERFNEAWALMGGQWNKLQFERLLQTVHFGRQFPVLTKITEQMGRVADPGGKQRIGYASGRTGNVEHCAQSDITGVTLGRELGAMLPLEWAQFLDGEMEGIFLRKYVTGRLQTFSSQSRSLSAARSLHTKAARPRGPMVVCADMSGSMMGEPAEIALSLMMRLCEMCEHENRLCYLIAFSTSATPIDVLHDRPRLLQFFRSRADGGTDARRMMDETYRLLHTNPDYAGADVLWVTDFRIPLPEPHYLQQMELLRKDGTRFYGLQLGVAENKWTSRFDKMYQIADVKMEIR